MKKLWDNLVAVHWYMFMYNAGYFLLTFWMVVLYLIIKLYIHKYNDND